MANPRKLGTRLTAVVATLAMGWATGGASAAEWGKLSAMLDQHMGVYTSETKQGSPWATKYAPDGPQYTALVGLTIGMQAPPSLADGKSVTASGYIAANQAPEMLTDGLDSTKWCATLATSGETSAWNTRDLRLRYSNQESPEGANDAASMMTQPSAGSSHHVIQNSYFEGTKATI